MKTKKVTTKLKSLIFDINDLFPNFGKILVYGWDILHRLKFKITLKLLEIRKADKLKKDLPFQNQYTIKIEKIQNFFGDEKKKSSKINSLDYIDWDLFKRPIKELPEFTFLKEILFKKRDWKDTDYYNKLVLKFNAGKNYSIFSSISEFNEEVEYLINLFSKFKNSGKKSEYFNEESFEEISKEFNFKKIGVYIDRNGHYLLNSGRLNFSFYKMIHIPKIKVMIEKRHPDWINFKKELYLFNLNYQNNKLYQKLTHPDLQDIPYRHGDERFNLIKKNLNTNNGTLLDIGANLGYFCQKFEEEGFNCTAVEFTVVYVKFMKKLRLAENKSFKIVQKSIFNYKRNEKLIFDVVFALNVFHHFLMRKTSFNNFVELLNRLETRELFFEAHNPEEINMQNSYRNFQPEEFVQFILDNTNLDKSKLLYEFNSGRKLYKIYKTI